MQKKSELKKQGKKNRRSGAYFETKVRKHLESRDWITDKWTQNIDLIEKRIIPAKRKFNPFNRILSIGTGFPDFIAFKPIIGEKKQGFHVHKVIGVESKTNGYLEKEEKEKCQFLLDNNIFKNILIASKGKKPGEIRYIDFATKKEFSDI